MIEEKLRQFCFLSILMLAVKKSEVLAANKAQAKTSYYSIRDIRSLCQLVEPFQESACCFELTNELSLVITNKLLVTGVSLRMLTCCCDVVSFRYRVLYLKKDKRRNTEQV